jgi:outer membrane protein OmpA-like peptidoglycan-associated protein
LPNLFRTSDKSRAQDVVKRFYAAARDKDTNEAYKLTTADTPQSRAMVDKAIATVGTDCKPNADTHKQNGDTYMVNGSCEKGGSTWNFELNKKTDDAMKIQNIGFGAAGSGTGGANPGDTNNGNKLACLMPADARYFGADHNPTDVYKQFYTGATFFGPDVATFDDPTAADQVASQFAGFYMQAKDKAYTVNLYGEARETAQTDTGKQLAEQRIAAVRQALIDKGVPAERITAVQTTSSADASDPRADRKVSLNIVADKNCQ